MREAVPEIGPGRPPLMESGPGDIRAIRYDYERKSVVVLHNFAGAEKSCRPFIERFPEAVRLLEQPARPGCITAPRTSPITSIWLPVVQDRRYSSLISAFRFFLAAVNYRDHNLVEFEVYYSKYLKI
jgi:hypothetical protein